MKLADVVCASEEIAQKLAPEEAADTEKKGNDLEACKRKEKPGWGSEPLRKNKNG